MELEPLPFEPEPENDDAPFTVRDEATAAWAVGKINAAAAEVERRRAAAAEYVAEAEREERRLRERFEGELKLWARDNLPRGKRTLKLLTGKLEFRAVPGRWSVVRTDEALAYAKQHYPEAVKVEEKLLVSELLKVAGEGELIPGVEYIPEGESFKVK